MSLLNTFLAVRGCPSARRVADTHIGPNPTKISYTIEGRIPNSYSDLHQGQGPSNHSLNSLRRSILISNAGYFVQDHTQPTSSWLQYSSANLDHAIPDYHGLAHSSLAELGLEVGSEPMITAQGTQSARSNQFIRIFPPTWLVRHPDLVEEYYQSWEREISQHYTTSHTVKLWDGMGIMPMPIIIKLESLKIFPDFKSLHEMVEKSAVKLLWRLVVKVQERESSTGTCLVRDLFREITNFNPIEELDLPTYVDSLGHIVTNPFLRYLHALRNIINSQYSGNTNIAETNQENEAPGENSSQTTVGEHSEDGIFSKSTARIKIALRLTNTNFLINQLKSYVRGEHSLSETQLEALIANIGASLEEVLLAIGESIIRGAPEEWIEENLDYLNDLGDLYQGYQEVSEVFLQLFNNPLLRRYQLVARTFASARSQYPISGFFDPEGREFMDPNDLKELVHGVPTSRSEIYDMIYRYLEMSLASGHRVEFVVSGGGPSLRALTNPQAKPKSLHPLLNPNPIGPNPAKDPYFRLLLRLTGATYRASDRPDGNKDVTITFGNGNPYRYHP